MERLTIVAGQAALRYARQQDALLRAASEALSVTPEDLPRAAERFFSEWKDQQKRIKRMEQEIAKLRTSGGDGGSTMVDGVRVIVQEVDADLKQLTNMLGAMTRDPEQPTVAVLGSREGGGKLLVAVTEGTVAAERYDAVTLLRAISPHIRGGGGGRPTLRKVADLTLTGCRMRWRKPNPCSVLRSALDVRFQRGLVEVGDCLGKGFLGCKPRAFSNFRGFDLDVLTFGFGGRVGEGQEGEVARRTRVGSPPARSCPGRCSARILRRLRECNPHAGVHRIEVSSRERPVAHKVSTGDSTHQHLSIPVDDDRFAHHTVQASVDALTGHGMNRIVADEVVFPRP